MDAAEAWERAAMAWGGSSVGRMRELVLNYRRAKKVNDWKRGGLFAEKLLQLVRSKRTDLRFIEIAAVVTNNIIDPAELYAETPTAS